MEKFKIGRVEFSDTRVVIIAEAGVNHLGDIQKAEKLITAAKRAGADIIKFQTYKAEELTTKDAERFWSWEGEEILDGTQYDSYSKLDSFDMEDYQRVKEICDQNEIEFMSTPFDDYSVDMLVKVGVKGFKVASCDITNFPLLEKISSHHLPILLSTGGSSLDEVQNAVTYIESLTGAPILVMHCTLTYPTPPGDANLGAVLAFRETFPKRLIGLSDHTLGIEVASASVLLGVRAIEKHFTYDKSLPTSADHWLSADEEDMRELVQKANFWRGVQGSESKQVLDSELLARRNARRSIVASRSIGKGEILGLSDLKFKRPGTGIPPYEAKNLMGSRVIKNVQKDEIITLDHLESSG